MTSEAATAGEARHNFARLWHGSTGPVLIIIAAILVIWYAAAVWLNAPMLRIIAPQISGADLLWASWRADRPLLPAPHQVLAELWRTVIETSVTSKRSLVYHSWVTLSSALLGFAIGALLGILLAVAIVHVKSLEKSLLTWIIASQTVPILAVAPIIIVALGSLGLVGAIVCELPTGAQAGLGARLLAGSYYGQTIQIWAALFAAAALVALMVF